MRVYGGERKMLTKFGLAVAQSGSVKGDIAANIRRHEEFIKLAAQHGANLILFPELSLTGYEPEVAGACALKVDDPRLESLKKLAKTYQITVIAGAPIANRAGKPYLGALIIDEKTSACYCKQFLHPGEEAYFAANQDRNAYVIDIQGERIGMAICADTSHAVHIEAAAKQGATIYAAGVLFTEPGYARDAAMLQQYAVRYGMTVVIANHAAPTGKYLPAGGSCIWDQAGKVIIKADSGDTLLVVVKEAGKWRSQSTPETMEL
jgi:predicted amidohydrolase